MVSPFSAPNERERVLVVGRAAKNPFRFSDQRRLNIPVGLGDWPFYRAKWCAGPSPSLLLDGLDYSRQRDSTVMSKKS